MKYKNIILDFDGTMGDTRQLIVSTMQQTLAELHLPRRTDDECAAMIGLPLRQTFTQLMPMSAEMGRLCEDTYRRLFAENNHPGCVPLFPHVKETIEELHRRGHRLTIASSRSRYTLVEFLQDMQLESYIIYIVSATDIENAKPAPDMVLRTMDDLHLRREECVVVGDTVFDLQMAHRAGVDAVGVSYGNGTRAELEGENAEYIIDDFAELLDICEGREDD